ncbi:hypothetical protein V6A83_003748 [Serratia marcescens]
MTTIKRFTPDYKMHAVRFEAFAREAEHGEFVKFSDYEALMSELASIRQINAQTLQVKLTMAEAIKELTARVNALAVENADLKDAITTHSQSTHFCELCGKDDPCSTDDVCYVLNETPATEAALAAIRDAVLDRVIAKLGAMGSPDFTLMAVQALKNELREAK